MKGQQPWDPWAVVKGKDFYDPPASLRTTGLFEIFCGRNVRICRTGIIFHHNGGIPFFMVLLALIQVAPMIHEADLLRFLLGDPGPLSRTLDLPSGQSALRLPGSPDLRDCASRHLVRIKGDARDRKGLKPGI